MALLRRLLPVVDGRFILLVRKPLDAGRGPLLREDNSPAPQIAGCDDIGADLGRRRRVRRATLVPNQSRHVYVQEGHIAANGGPL